ncbi:MAG TPA: homocysteine S-methyltransferase family protein [Thermoanaerobaculia bacterium]
MPQLSPGLFLTDGGIETSLIYLDGLELPDFAAFTQLASEKGREALRRYFRGYAEIARRHGTGLILESATWRASPDWAARRGYSREQLAAANRDSIAMLEEIRREFEAPEGPIVLSGCVGPRGDGYDPGRAMSAEEAAAYHAEQIETFAGTEADLITAITMTSSPEAEGVARAAQRAGMPVVLSFTVETDGALPTGQGLADAIAQVDAATHSYPAYYMVNCAHPAHFADVLAGDGPALQRLRGLRANASRKSHAELNDSTELDFGNPAELASLYADLARRLPGINVMGGCCGTDHRHLEEIAAACQRLFA